MKRNLKHFSALLLCLSTILLAGCWDQKIFEDIGFILELGLEIDKEGKLLYSVTLPVVDVEIEEKIEILSTSVDLLREGRDALRNTSGKRIEGGKIQHINFSKELAQKGIGDMLDVFLRSPENPLLANLIVVDGSPLEMFEKSLGYKDKTRISSYMTEIVDDAMDRSCAPEMRIYSFSILENCSTIDPIVTMIRYDDKKIEVSGSALFNGDKMVGQIDCEETGLLHALMGEKINFEYFCMGHESQNEENKVKKGIAVLLKKVKRKIKIDFSEDKPKFNISMDFSSSVDESYKTSNLYLSEEEEKLEKMVAESIKEDCQKLLQKLKEAGSDPIGLGELMRAKYNDYFKSINWKEIYPQIDITVETKLNIESYGGVS